MALYKFIYQVSCDIGNEGLKHLTKSNWPKMKMLHLCICLHLTQLIILLELMVTFPAIKTTGNKFNKLG